MFSIFLFRFPLIVFAFILFSQNAGYAKNISNIVNIDFIGYQIKWFDKKFGVPFKILGDEISYYSFENEYDIRKYDIKGCKVDVLYLKGKEEIIGFGFDINPKCDVNIAPFLGQSVKEKEVLSTSIFNFKNLENLSEDVIYSSDCLAYCGNGYLPNVYASWEGSNADDNKFIILQAPDTEQYVGQATDNWTTFLRKYYSYQEISTGEFYSNKKNPLQDEITADILKNVKVSKIWVGKKIGIQEDVTAYGGNINSLSDAESSTVNVPEKMSKPELKLLPLPNPEMSVTGMGFKNPFSNVDTNIPPVMENKAGPFSGLEPLPDSYFERNPLPVSFSKQAPEQRPKEPSLTEQVDQLTISNAVSNLLTSQGVSPDERLRAKEISSFLKVPEGVVASDMKKYERDYAYWKNYLTTRNNNDLLAWSSDPEKVQKTIDDLNTLRKGSNSKFENKNTIYMASGIICFIIILSILAYKRTGIARLWKNIMKSLKSTKTPSVNSLESKKSNHKIIISLSILYFVLSIIVYAICIQSIDVFFDVSYSQKLPLHIITFLVINFPMWSIHLWRWATENKKIPKKISFPVLIASGLSTIPFASAREQEGEMIAISLLIISVLFLFLIFINNKYSSKS